MQLSFTNQIVTKLRGWQSRPMSEVSKVSELAGTATFLAVVPASQAYAQTTGTDPATILQNIATFILGSFGQSLAILGIVAIGLSWMFGRASLGLIAGVVGGIVIMFGASYLATTLIGTGGGQGATP